MKTILEIVLTFSTLWVMQWIDHKCDRDMYDKICEPMPWLIFYGVAAIVWATILFRRYAR